MQRIMGCKHSPKILWRDIIRINCTFRGKGHKIKLSSELVISIRLRIKCLGSWSTLRVNTHLGRSICDLNLIFHWGVHVSDAKWAKNQCCKHQTHVRHREHAPCLEERGGQSRNKDARLKRTGGQEDTQTFTWVVWMWAFVCKSRSSEVDQT